MASSQCPELNPQENRTEVQPPSLAAKPQRPEVTPTCLGDPGAPIAPQSIPLFPLSYCHKQGLALFLEMSPAWGSQPRRAPQGQVPKVPKICHSAASPVTGGRGRYHAGMHFKAKEPLF